jgi:hypothetical protein
MIVEKMRPLYENLAAKISINTILIIAFVALSTIPAALCVVLIGLALVIAYILFTTMLVLIVIQWCVSSKRSKKSYITEK